VIEWAKEVANMADVKLLMRVRGQLIMLSIQFLLGMAVNLLGEPESSLAKASKGILLGLHVLIALGLLVGASLTMHFALKAGGQILRTTRLATAGVGLALVAGVLTVMVKGSWSDAWSYAMAVGFLVALVFYGKLYMKLRS
jgi:hypothetical protein